MAKEMAILAFLFFFLASGIVQRIAAATPALYAFGDSTTDVGNFVPEENQPFSKKPPFGIDYPDGTPTGRFSNGFLVVDYIAAAMGLPNSPLPFRAITNDAATDIGVNFASGGSGVLNTTAPGIRPPSLLTLDEQIEDFRKIAANLTERMGEHLASIQLAQSLFYISTGSNDIFFQTFFKDTAAKDQLLASMTSKFREQIQTLHKLGARKFAVIGTAPIGLTPIARFLSLFFGPNYLDGLNDLSQRFKTAVKTMLEILGATLEGFEYSFTDAYEVGMQVNANPSAYGFTEIEAACCGGGKSGLWPPCGQNATYCSDRTQYVFWDFIHPTQAVYKLLAQVALKGSPPLVTPVNVYRLISTSSPYSMGSGTAVA